jgi:hypothetical protein
MAWQTWKRIAPLATSLPLSTGTPETGIALELRAKLEKSLLLVRLGLQRKLPQHVPKE